MAKYTQRKGTTENLGFEYEDQMIAYLAVAACNQKDLKDFWIANNVDGLGAWDDIVLYTETLAGKKTLTFLQLKHKQDPNKILQFKDYKQDINTYAKDFQVIKSEINNQQTQLENIKLLTGVPLHDMDFILLTNGEFNNNSTNFTSISSKFKNLFIMTNTNGLVYEISERNSAYQNNTDFRKQFTIISEQSGVTNAALLNNIVTQLEIFTSQANVKYHLDIAKILPSVINKWFRTENRVLSRIDVKKIINFRILSALNYTQPINDKKPELDEEKWAKFQNLIKTFQLIVFSNHDLILKNFIDEQNITLIISCNMKDIQFVIDRIKTDINIKVLLLLPNELLQSVSEEEISTLNLLNALSDESLALLNDFEISIQGRETKFGTLLNLRSDLKNILNVDDLITLLLGKFCIGEDNLYLSYYVPRTIPRIFVKKSIILEKRNSNFIVIVEDNLVETELTIKSSLQLKSSSAVYGKQSGTNDNLLQCVKRDAVSEAVSNIKSDSNSVHVLKYHQNNNKFKLEWIFSTGNIKDVKDFIDNEKCDVKSIKDNLADLCWNIVNKVIIVANPGMGKTYFTKNLANRYSVHSWVILVTLNEIDFKHIDNFRLFLQSYSETLKSNDKNLFEFYLRKKSVLVLFDGFDEVAPHNELEALKLINGAIQEKLKIVVTSREVTKEILEKNLETLAYTLNPFSNDDKIKFLSHFYFENVKKIDNVGKDAIDIRINEFAVNMLKNCSISNWDEEFTGVPLQCRLLAEGFIEDCQRYCETGDESNIPKSLYLITLYETFIDKKMNIHIVEKGKATSYLMKATNKLKNIYLENHLKAAVQIIFPQVGIKIPNDFLEEVKIAEERNGIITGLDENGKPVFIHRTFAEYFAAKWLVDIKEGKTQLEESKREEYLKFLLKPEYNVVKDLFDRIICKQCELHNAVLNADLWKVRDILKSGNGDDGKCGRNALHLISARGARHEQVKRVRKWVINGKKEYWTIQRKENEKYVEVFDCLLEKCDWIQEKDKVLRWTPQNYAEDRNAFGVIDRLCGLDGNQLHNLDKSFMSEWNTDEILRMCATYDYMHLVEKVIQSKKINSHQLSSPIYSFDYPNAGSLLHLAAENGSVKILDVLLKYIDVNIKNSEGRTPLHLGGTKGHLGVVKALVEKGGNLFLRNNRGETPMDYAESGGRELIEYVTSYEVLKIAFGEDINAALPECFGRSALHYAAIGNNIFTLERLISEGANVNITTKHGDTALLLLTYRNTFHADIARRLIESGLDIDAKNPYGYTALHGAALSGRKECVDWLLQNGANANIFDSENKTALSVAREQRHNDIFLILWDKTGEELKSDRDVLHKSVLTEGHNVEVRKRTFVGHPEELSHLVDTMSEAGLYYYGVKDAVRCFSCKCWLYDWKASDDPWVEHAKDEDARNCQFLIQEKGKEFIQRWN